MLAILKWLVFTGPGRAVLGAAVIALLYMGAKAAWNTYNDTVEELGRVQQELSTQKEENDKLQAKHDKYVTDIQETIRLEQQEKARLRVDLQDVKDRNDELSKTLAMHDLSYLAERKPTLIRRRINSATKRVLADIEKATRSGGGGHTSNASPGRPANPSDNASGRVDGVQPP